MTPDETIPFIQSIQDKINLVHVSAGIDTRLDLTLHAHPSIFSPHGCNVFLAAAMKKSVSIPVVTVGAIGTPELAEQILKEGRADAVAMCRALIADPFLPSKARTGRDDEINPCTRCLHCRGHMDVYKHFSCAVNPRAAREMRYPAAFLPAPARKKILVIGGGPGGMKAAVCAAERGHDVILADKKNHLGGQLIFTDYDAIKADLRAQKDYLIRMVHKSNVNVLLNNNVNREFVRQVCPDAIVVATGASPVIPSIPGIGGPNVLFAADIYPHINTIGRTIVIIGGGLVGIETGLSLADAGKRVTIVEITDRVARDANRLYAQALRLAIQERNLDIRTNTQCKSISGNTVTLAGPNGNKTVIQADAVVYAVGMRANKEIYREVYDCAPKVLRAGDCIQPGTYPRSNRGRILWSYGIITVWKRILCQKNSGRSLCSRCS